MEENKIALKQRLAVLGSTGSIGCQTLDIVRRYGDLFEITSLSSNNNWELLVSQAIEFQPDNVVIANKEHYTKVKDALTSYPIKVYAGSDALEQVVCSAEVDTVVVALVGYCGLFPTVNALKHGKKVALANKESLVVAGEIVMATSAQYNAPIIPVDSEHSAIFQCLVGEITAIEKIILTASGGPFLHTSAEDLESVSVYDALKHPNWSMGAKITIDSATMMNKGFEVIEAKWLFSLRPEQIEVVIHPGSFIHSMVQFCDGAIKAQLGTPDMHLPIQYALSFPKRLPLSGERLDFAKCRTLEFYSPDTDKFPNLAFAYDCLKTGGSAPAILNAANEVAVAAFIKGAVRFTDIARINEKVLSKMDIVQSPTLEQYRIIDAQARELASALVEKQLKFV